MKNKFCCLFAVKYAANRLADAEIIMYIHERKDWPEFHWNKTSLTVNLLAEARYLQGQLLGRMGALGFELQEEATLQSLTSDVIKSSEIEGEKLNKSQVRSSIAKRLGVDIGGGSAHLDRNVEGIVEVMLDATRNYELPLTSERLFGWHSSLFPTTKSGLQRVSIGKWRTKESGPMQVVSGAYGREKVHYEAPSFDRLKKEMNRFLKWFELTDETDLVIKSACAHFWFVTIHPFDDGNGRIARAIGDMMLARSEKCGKRFYSMSSQIQKERKSYYDILESCQKGSLDITAWIEWYLNCLKRSIDFSQELLESILVKARFWENHVGESFNFRQRKIINQLFDGFEGHLTTSKWAKITKCSQDTALRDIHDLLDRKILFKNEAGGRSTNYILSF
jgi:Fic family protein